VLRTGGVRWIAARGRVLRDRDGTPVRMLGAAYDTTARQEGEARTGRVLESMPTAFLSLSRDWRFTYVNAAAERVLGRDRDALLGGDLWELFPAAVGSDFETAYRGAMGSGEPAAFDAYYPPPLDAWYEVRAWPGPDGLAVYFLDVTARRRAQARVDDAARSAALLAEVTAELGETLDAEEAVGRLAQLVVPAMADWCIVTLVDDEAHVGARHALRDIGWAHARADALPVVERYADLRLGAMTGESLLARAVRTGEPVVVEHDASGTISRMLTSEEARQLLVELGPEAVTVLPLRARGGTVGLMSLFIGPERAPLTDEELALAREVAARAALALDNSRLYREQRQLAEGLQRALLTEPPPSPGLEIVVRYEPAGQAAQVGGDWYDAFVQPDGATVLVIGDVAGHDVTAAAEMGQLRSLMRGIAVATGAGPAELLGEVDQAMLTLQAGTIATAVVARLEPPDGDDRGRTVLWSNAGHPPPMLIRPDGTVTEVTGERTDLLLGVVPEVARTEHTAVVEDGATLFLYTDGLVERRDQSLAEGLGTLRDALADVADRSLDEIRDAVLRRMRPPRRDDDVALVAVRVGAARR
jgi:serine phosphatase RsbU (regulator of sigma subunit)